MALNYPSDWTHMSPRIPFVGKWKRKSTFIEQMWVQPCGVSPALYVAGAFAALPHLAFAILQPDCLDSQFARVGRPHRTRRKPVMDISDLMSAVAAPKGGIGAALFQGAQLAQRFGFYTLLVDATLDWIIHGTSLAFQMAGCEDPANGFCNMKMENVTVALFPAQSFTCNTWHLVDSHIMVGDGDSIESPVGFAAGAGFSLSQNLKFIPSLPDASWSARMIDNTTGWQTGFQDSYEGPNGKPNLTYFNAAGFASNTAHSFRVIIQKSAGVLNMNGTFTAGAANIGNISGTACGHSTAEIP